MRATIQKWGNSLALRLPKPFTSEINISENSTVDISLENNQIVIRPIKSQVNIEDLIAAITPDNLHSEISTGQPIGKEMW